MKAALLAMVVCLTSMADPNGAFAAYGSRISQVYAGGGGDNAPGATYRFDYVEVFNSHIGPIDIGGWTLEYMEPGGNWGSTPSSIFVFPEGAVLGACSYLLIRMGPGGDHGTGVLPTADFVGSLSIQVAGGTIGLFTTVNMDTPCGAEIGLRDKVACGAGACAEAAPIGPLAGTTGAVRKRDGNMDTDNNQNDFAILEQPVPHSGTGPGTAYCFATPTSRGTWGSVKILYR